MSNSLVAFALPDVSRKPLPVSVSKQVAAAAEARRGLPAVSLCNASTRRDAPSSPSPCARTGRQEDRARAFRARRGDARREHSWTAANSRREKSFRALWPPGRAIYARRCFLKHVIRHLISAFPCNTDQFAAFQNCIPICTRTAYAAFARRRKADCCVRPAAAAGRSAELSTP